MEEGDGDERVDGVGDELLLGECELVILKLILVQEVGDHGCEMWPCFPFRKRKPWHEQREARKWEIEERERKRGRVGIKHIFSTTGWTMVVWFSCFFFERGDFRWLAFFFFENFFINLF